MLNRIELRARRVNVLPALIVTGICMTSAACAIDDKETSEITQGVVVIPDGVECYVDTPAFDEFTPGGCWGLWANGPLYSSATFRLSSRVLSLLGDGSSPNFAWSDSRCSSNPYLECTLPIRRNFPVTLRALLTSTVNGALLWQASATAEYTTVAN